MMDRVNVVASDGSCEGGVVGSRVSLTVTTRGCVTVVASKVVVGVEVIATVVTAVGNVNVVANSMSCEGDS